MTREEAIRQIEQVGWTLSDFLRDAERDALDLAIEVLQAESANGRIINADKLKSLLEKRKQFFI